MTGRRGELLPYTEASRILATVHRSAILRAPDEVSRHHEMQRFIKDLQVVAEFIAA